MRRQLLAVSQIKWESFDPHSVSVRRVRHQSKVWKHFLLQVDEIRGFIRNFQKVRANFSSSSFVMSGSWNIVCSYSCFIKFEVK